jgi:2-amino-4-hydroxy-6-hydroxymethyldihydropteridine diphosphokinase
VHDDQNLPLVSRAFLSLGSNLGDRRAYLRAAAEALGRGPEMELLAISRVYETVPVEVDDVHPDYLNCVVELECGVSAIELLRYCQGIEGALGRERKGEKEPRTIDIDVLLFGEQVIEKPPLGVPHHGVTRAFNIKGLADLDQELHIPGRGWVGELLAGADSRGIEEVEGLC